jgi:SAM-dependent methyltransferase
MEHTGPPDGRTRAWRAPALQAALIHVLALAPTLAAATLGARLGLPLGLAGAAFVQGVFAASLTWAWKLDVWWRPIQLLFPIALVGAQTLHVPPVALLGGFAFLLLLFWSTFKTRVPFFPSGPAVWRAVAELLPPDRPVRLVDIGSGLGGLVLDLARRRPACVACGVELAPLPWLFSVLRARLTGSPARFMRGDYERLDFAEFDVVFAYLSPAAMQALWRKAEREMRPGALLVSYEFDVAGRPSNRIVAAAPSGPPLFVWSF